MKFVLLSVLIFALLAIGQASDDPSVALEGVVDLTDSSFDSVVGSTPAFIEFYAPWCGHCKTLAPVYAEVGKAYAAHSSKVLIAKVDADKYREAGSRFGVTGFPTLKWFPKGINADPEDYSGGRTADDIVKFVNGKTGLSARIVKAPTAVAELTPANFASVVDGTKDVLVEFFAPWCGHCKRLAPDYEKVARAFRAEPNVVVASVDADAHRELGAKFEVSGYPTIKFFARGSTTPVDYSEGRDPESFVRFLNKQAGTQRTVAGRLGDSAGLVASLDSVVRGFAALSESDRTAAVAAFETAAADVTGADAKSVAIYRAILKRIQEKGAEFVTSETQRVSRMIESGNVSAQKADDLQIRLNILQLLK